MPTDDDAKLSGLVYLASPYNHFASHVRQARFEGVCKAAAKLMAHGTLVFSPIAHTHPIAQFGLPKGWEFWERYDRAMLSACSTVVVLTLDGWQESKGVTAEIAIAREQGKPVWLLAPTGGLLKPLPETGEQPCKNQD